MIHIIVSGACGKMGRRILALAMESSDIKISGAIENSQSGESGKDIGAVLGTKSIGVKVSSDLGNTAQGSDCLIEFSTPGATVEHLKICCKMKLPMVIGTTGLTPENEDEIRKAAKTIPIVFSPNMALGVNLLFKIVKDVSRTLGRDCKIEIDETHHVHKKDAPSGTAKKIADIIREVTGNETPIKSFREGEIIGEHGLVFDTRFEKLTIRHEAKSRDVFASGALVAARFIVGKPAGLYTMADVLGLQ